MSKLCGLLTAILLACLGSAFSKISFAQSEEMKAISRISFAFKASSLGAGAEAATPLSRRSNLRVGFNRFGYGRNFHKDGIGYAGQLSFRSVEAHFDWFPFFGSFRVSPGVLVYNGNQLTAGASVPAGQRLTLNGVSYVSDPANPVSGGGKIAFNKAGPMITAGWGNLLPRNGGHFSIPFEMGIIYTGAPQATLNFAGNVCDVANVNCRSISSDRTVLSNVQGERAKLNRQMSGYQVYPVVALGFGFSF